MMRSAICTLAFSVSIVLTGILLTGCDDTDGTDGLTVSPSSYTMTSEETTKSFTASGSGSSSNATDSTDLALPLTWTTSNDGLGSITHSDGWSAVYTRGSANGNNTLTVRDQYGNEGYATVKQTAATYTLTLTASPSAEIPFGSDTVTITATGTDAQAPYAWTVESGNGSFTGGQGTATVVYKTTDLAASVVKCTDANGASGTISITHASPTP